MQYSIVKEKENNETYGGLKMKDYKLVGTLNIKELQKQLNNWGFKKEAKEYKRELAEIGMYANDYNEYVAQAIEDLTDLTTAVFLDDYIENTRILLENVEDIDTFILMQTKIIERSYNYFSNTEGSYIIEAREDLKNECLLLDIYELDAE